MYNTGGSNLHGVGKRLLQTDIHDETLDEVSCNVISFDNLYHPRNILALISVAAFLLSADVRCLAENFRRFQFCSILLRHSTS